LSKLIAAACMSAVMALGGCASLLDRAAVNFADDLESAIRSYDESSTVEAGLPAYLLLMEARLQSRPDDADLRLTTARLTSTYATLFGNDDRAVEQRLTRRALEHARAGACAHSSQLCALHTFHFEDLEVRAAQLDRRDLKPVYVLATTWTSWIAVHSDDFTALADLPRVEMLLEWVAEKDPSHDDGAVWLYLAVLNSQRPPAAGGQPRKAKDYFDRAVEQSAGRNLLVNVMMADSYARLMFDRALYVDQLEQVLAASDDEPDYRLINQVARARARIMLDQTEAIFD
jgi:hypothetical protein